LITTMGIITAVSSTADLVDNINNNNMSILDCGKQRKTNCEQVKKGRKEPMNGSMNDKPYSFGGYRDQLLVLIVVNRFFVT
jgi:hypothetical protein